MSGDTLTELWEKIGRLKSFQFKALNLGKSPLAGWSGQGYGVIDLEHLGSNEIRSYESGRYSAELLPTEASHFKIQNAYEWVLKKDCIQLSHVRYDLPVKLVEIMPEKACKTLVSIEAHVCGKDCYSAKFYLIDEGFRVEWKIKGSRKDEKLFYSYFI